MKRKLITSYFLIILIAVFITAFFQAQFAKKIYINEVKEKLIQNSNAIEWILNKHKVSYKEITLEFAKKMQERITIIDTNGKVLADSDIAPKFLKNHKNRPEVKQAFKGKRSFTIRYSSSLGKKLMYYAIPLQEKKQKYSVLRLSLPLQIIEEIDSRFYRYVVIDMIWGILGGIILAYIYTKKISKPISQMVNTSKYISSGNFDTKLEINSDDELSILATSFNFIVDKMNQLIKELQERNEEMESVLNSMITGVIGIDSEHKILYVNLTAKKWLNIEKIEFEGKSILNVIRSSELDNELIKALENGVNKSDNLIIQNKNKYYKIYINVKKHGGTIDGAVIVMQDITEEKNYNEMRTQFVANVSHELKTPLTSILGFIETLREVDIEDVDTRMRFLNIIEKEAKRLQNLIKDILELSYLENKKTTTEVTRVDLKELISEVFVILSKASDNKNIKLKMECDDIQIVANKDKMKQMLINLVDNGIKYTQSGGRVKVKVRDLRNRVEIKIIDNGIGIKAEDMERLFERFYRVDKSRSRVLGGTGLGLAIVKHIVMGMNGKIDVESKESSGTTFTVVLPKFTQT